jgi:hypothetical protein
VTLFHVTLFESVQHGGAEYEIVIPIRAVLVLVLERRLYTSARHFGDKSGCSVAMNELQNKLARDFNHIISSNSATYLGLFLGIQDVNIHLIYVLLGPGAPDYQTFHVP